MPRLSRSKMKCCLCGSRGVNVYSFPSAKYHDVYEKWIETLSSQNITVSSSPEEVRQNLRICEMHFNEDDFFIAYKSNKTRRKLLKHNSVPFINNNAVYTSINGEITNSEADLHENQMIKPTGAETTQTTRDDHQVENICIPVACTDFIPNLNVNGVQDTHRLYKLCLRQQETIAKQRKIIKDLEIRLKLLGNDPQTDNNLNTEFVAHQRQNTKKPKGRRYSKGMKLFGVQMLKQGTIADYEKWRKLFVMPSRRTLERVSKRKVPLHMNTNERSLKNPQMTAINKTSGNECSSNKIPLVSSELASTPQD